MKEEECYHLNSHREIIRQMSLMIKLCKFFQSVKDILKKNSQVTLHLILQYWMFSLYYWE